MKRIIVFFVLLFIILSVALIPQETELTMAESKIKSGYIFNLCRYTKWSRKEAPDEPIIISVLGETSWKNKINIPENRKIGQKSVRLRNITQLADIGDSHMLFITGSESHRIEEIVQYVKDKDILTIGDTKGYAEKGVIVNFYTKGLNVLLEINIKAEKTSSVTLAAQLISMSRLVGVGKNG